MEFGQQSASRIIDCPINTQKAVGQQQQPWTPKEQKHIHQPIMAISCKMYERLSCWSGNSLSPRHRTRRASHDGQRQQRLGENIREEETNEQVVSSPGAGRRRTLQQSHSKRHSSSSEFDKDLQLELALNMIKKDPLPLWSQERLLQDHLVHPASVVVSSSGNSPTRRRDMLQENVVNPLHTATHRESFLLEAVSDEEEEGDR